MHPRPFGVRQSFVVWVIASLTQTPITLLADYVGAGRSSDIDFILTLSLLISKMAAVNERLTSLLTTVYRRSVDLSNNVRDVRAGDVWRWWRRIRRSYTVMRWAGVLVSLAGVENAVLAALGCWWFASILKCMSWIVLLLLVRCLVVAATSEIEDHAFWCDRPDIWHTVIDHEDALGYGNLNQCVQLSSFCTTCEGRVWESLGEKTHHHKYKKSVYVPRECTRCNPTKFLYHWRPKTVKAEKMEVYLSESEYSRLSSALNHHRAVSKRDAQTAWISALSSGGQLSTREDYMCQHMARFEALYHAPLRKTWWGWEQIPNVSLLFWFLGFLPYGRAGDEHQSAWATPWMPIPKEGEESRRVELSAAPTGDMENSPKNNDGKVPQLIATSLDEKTRADLKTLTGKEVRDVPLGAIEVENKPGYLQPVGGAVFECTYDNKAVKAGPIFNMPHVFGTRSHLNKCLALLHRTQPEKSLKKNSGVYTRYLAFVRTLHKNVFTRENIRHALTQAPPLEELLRKKLSEDEVENLLSACEFSDPEIRSDWSGFKRKLTVKLEGIIKTGKAPRGIQDEGFMRLAMNTLIGWVYEYLLFHTCESISIKHKDKMELADAMVREFGPNDPKLKHARRKMLKWRGFRFLEIDQTKMESHVRMKQHEGLMFPVKAIHDDIVRNGRDMITPTVVRWFSAINQDDRMKGMSMAVPGDEHNEGFLMKYDDYYMPSGWRFTSSANFLVELGVTMSAICRNPERLWAMDPATGKTHLEGGTHDFMFMSLCPGKNDKHVYLRPRVEGDDVGAHCSDHVEEYKDLVLRNFEDAGMSTKMVIVNNGRGEFVGLHFPIKDGCIDQNVPWVPAVARGLAKIGVITGAGDSPAAIAYPKFLSLAAMYAGRVPPLAMGFYKLAMSWKELLDEGTELKIDHDMHRQDASVGEVGGVMDSNQYEAKVALAVASQGDAAVTARAIAMSCEKPCTVDEVSHFQMLMESIRYDTDATGTQDMLPACLR